MINFLFGKKQNVQALAELLEDGREIMDEEMKKPKYNNYSGREVFIDLAVRVQPENEPPFEANMTASLLKAYLLKPGIRVQVQYDPEKKEQVTPHVSLQRKETCGVTMQDEPAQILEPNPQLKK